MDNFFDIHDKVIVITGGAGVLCRGMALALAKQGARVAVLDLDEERAKLLAREINEDGGCSIGIRANVLDRPSLEAAKEMVQQTFGRIDVLINGAGGNKKDATSSEELRFFDIPADALRWVFDLNFLGTVLATQVFGEAFVAQGDGIIVNVSSMASLRPLTRVMAYAAAKAALNNFTQWLAVHLNQNYSPRIRVNAIAPGFFITEQNRFLLTTPDGGTTERGRRIIDHTPMGRYGEPEDLIGTLIWLISDASRFVNGVVIPIDGGFSAFSGI